MTLTFITGGIGLALPAIIFGLAFLLTIGFWERRFIRAGYGPDPKNGGYLPWYTIIGTVTGIVTGIFLGAILVAENFINPVWWVALGILGAFTIGSWIASLFKSRKKGKGAKVGFARKVKYFSMAFFAGLLIGVPVPKKQKHISQPQSKIIRA